MAASIDRHEQRGEIVLRPSPDLELPAQAVTRTFMVLAQRGAGKTYTASVLFEEMVGAHLPCIAIDPLGVMWGIRSNAAGDGPGLPVTIIGGEHGDVPLEATSGRVLAEFVVETQVPCVFDVSLLRRDEQVEFVTDFATALFHLKAARRDPLHVIIDEADLFAPQRENKTNRDVLDSIEDLVRRGRSRGLGLTLITQRPAVLNKNVLTQADCLVILRMTAPHDRKAIAPWVELNATPEQQKDVMTSLASLPIGTAWFWSPGWLEVCVKARIRKRKTLDTSGTPEPGKRAIRPRVLAPVELDVLKARIADTIERVDANDPDALKKKIADLEHELAKVRAEPERVTVEVPRVPEAVVHAAVRLKQRLSMALQDVEIIDAAAGDARPLEFVTDEPPASEVHSSQLRPAPPTPAPKPAASQAKRPPNSPQSLGAGERAILSVLGRKGPLDKIALAVRTLYKHSGGGFGNYVSALRSAGLVDGDAARLQLTERGRALNVREQLPTGRALLDAWLGKVGGGAPRKALEELASVFPRRLTKDALGHRTGYEPSGGGFTNALSKLRSLGLVKGKRELGLTDAFAAAIVGSP